MQPMNMLELASTLPRAAAPVPAADPAAPRLDPPPEPPPGDAQASGEHVVRPAERIGASADGRPLYRAVAGWEPTTAFELSRGGNWIEARVEWARRTVPDGADPRAERLGGATLDEEAEAEAAARAKTAPPG